MHYVIWCLPITLVANSEVYKGYNFEFLSDFKYDDDIKHRVRVRLYEKHMALRNALRQHRKRPPARGSVYPWSLIALMQAVEFLYVSVNLSRSNPFEMEFYVFEFSFVEGEFGARCTQIRSATIPVWFEGGKSQELVSKWCQSGKVLMSGVHYLQGCSVVGWNLLRELNRRAFHLRPPRIKLWAEDRSWMKDSFLDTYVYHEALSMGDETYDRPEFPLFVVTNILGELVHETSCALAAARTRVMEKYMELNTTKKRQSRCLSLSAASRRNYLKNGQRMTVPPPHSSHHA